MEFGRKFGVCASTSHHHQTTQLE